jgi:catechol 2,3-dioxygenase-like lactoylglutathione lyase family enzyme
MTWTRIDHVQLAMPPGREFEAEAFYVDVLGFEVRPKPEPLASRGGRWFQAGGVQVHLGVEEHFRPAQKAHPALVADDLDAVVENLSVGGYGVRWDTELPDTRRCYVDDPFGNRIELIDGST